MAMETPRDTAQTHTEDIAQPEVIADITASGKTPDISLASPLESKYGVELGPSGPVAFHSPVSIR